MVRTSIDFLRHSICFSSFLAGFFSKTNYSFVQLTAGLDLLESDSTRNYITYACVVTLLLPGLVTTIALIVIVRQQCCLAKRDPYDDFDD